MKKILIIKIGAIGDLLMATPAIKAIKTTFATASLWLLVGKWAKEVIKYNPYIDGLITVDDNLLYKGNLLEKARLFIELLKRLQKERFEAVVVLHRAWQFNLLAFLAKIPIRAGFKRGWEGIFLTHTTPSSQNIHEIDQYLNVARLIGANYNNRKMEIYLTDEEILWADNLLKELNITENDIIIGISPGGANNPKENMPSRRWTEEGYAQVADRLIKEYKTKVIFFGNDSDLKIVNRILRLMKETPINLVGKTTVREFIALSKRCNIFITHDSGPMHIAAALDIPTIAIFGPTLPIWKAPLGDKHSYLTKNLPCSPCYIHGRFPECHTHECMSSISPNEVLTKVFEKLSMEDPGGIFFLDRGEAECGGIGSFGLLIDILASLYVSSWV